MVETRSNASSLLSHLLLFSVVKEEPMRANGTTRTCELVSVDVIEVFVLGPDTSFVNKKEGFVLPLLL